MTDTLTERPPEQHSDADRELAMIWISGGKTAAATAARAADPSSYDTYRTPEGLRALAGGEEILRLLVPGDDLAAEMAARDASLAAAMAVLEAEGWTPPKARAALRAARLQPADALREAAAA